MKTVNRRHERAVEAIAERLLSGSVSLEPIPTYPDSIVYAMRGDDRALVFKAHDRDGRDRDGIAAEAFALESAKGDGVPVPDVVEMDASQTHFPGSYLVTTFVTGVPLDSLDARDVAAFAPRVGEMLRRLHSHEMAGFGHLAVAEGRATGEYTRWDDFVSRGIPNALDYLRDNRAPGLDVDRLCLTLDSALQNLADPPRSELLHGDLGENHVFVDPERGRITAFVDFGEACAGLWLWDLLEFDRRILPPILDGYGVARDGRAAVDRLVTVHALLKAVPWAAKWHQRGEPQVVNWLQQALDMYEQDT